MFVGFLFCFFLLYLTWLIDDPLPTVQYATSTVQQILHSNKAATEARSIARSVEGWHERVQGVQDLGWGSEVAMGPIRRRSGVGWKNRSGGLGVEASEIIILVIYNLI